MISIITPSLNSGRFIEETIKSVLAQAHADLEYIVVDGSSTDGTIDILRKYERQVKWISEHDNGQADGINKGFRMAKGEVLAWLNADDLYRPGVLHQVGEFFGSDSDLMMVYGDGNLIDEKGTLIEEYPSEKFELTRLPYTCFICQPACFFRRSLLEAVGYLDTRLEYAMDLDLWIRFGMLKKKNPEWKFAYVPTRWAGSRMHRAAKTLSQRQASYRELVEVIRKHFGFIPFNWVYGLAEVSNGYHDAYFDRSPLLFSLIAKSALRWMWMNRTRPDHIVRFAARSLGAPRQSLDLLRKRAAGRV